MTTVRAALRVEPCQMPVPVSPFAWAMFTCGAERLQHPSWEEMRGVSHQLWEPDMLCVSNIFLGAQRSRFGPHEDYFPMQLLHTRPFPSYMSRALVYHINEFMFDLDHPANGHL